ncbi:MAG TPA: BMP family protein [Conexibacter sp.]|nr:BMP family protein [Conexibacter sp.]
MAALCAALAACGGSGSDQQAQSKGSGAAKEKIALVYTGPADDPFSQPGVQAAKEIESKLGNEVTVQGGLTLADVQTTLEGYASRGYGLVIVNGAEMQQQAQLVAARHPDVRFVVINGDSKAAPNLSSVTYAWEEAGYLAGISAGLSTKSNKVGQVSSLKIPPIERLYSGFEQGVKQVNPAASVTNSFMTKFLDVGNAADLASAQAAQGIDVLFNVATGADAGLFRAARQHDMKVVGYAIDQKYLGPGNILTSVLVAYRRDMLDVARQFNEGKLEPRVYVKGFADNAFALAPIAGVPQATADKIQRVAQQAISGDLGPKPAAQ